MDGLAAQDKGRAAGEGLPGRLAISSDGRLAASFEEPNSEADFNKLKVVKKTIKVFDAETARPVNSFDVEVSEEMPGEPAFSPDGRKLAFHDGDALKIFDLTNGGVVRTFTLNDKSNLNLDFSRDGNMIAARAHRKGKTLDEYPYSLKLWDIASGKEPRTIIKDASKTVAHSALSATIGSTFVARRAGT